MFQKHRSDLLFWGVLLACLVIGYYSINVVLPFIIGLGFAYLVDPIVTKFRRVIKNRTWAVTAYLVASLGVMTLIVVLFAGQISRDFSRMNSAIRSYAESHHSEIKASSNAVYDLIEGIIPPEELELKLQSFSMDALEKDSSQVSKFIADLDTDAIQESLSSFGALFSSDQVEDAGDSAISWLAIIFGSVGYFFYIIYTLEYFKPRVKKYGSVLLVGTAKGAIDDFRTTFSDYFIRRSGIVVCYAVVLTLAFFIVGIPGALLLGILGGLLCYIAYLQYLVLIPVAISCLMLTLETGGNFYLYFGVILAVLVIMSLIEELVLLRVFLGKYDAVNPAILMFSLAFWTYWLGWFGILISLPLTWLVLSYARQLFASRIES